jgi:hypothetical protein
MGRYRGNINNVKYNVDDNNSVRSRGAKNWAAATTHNAVQEYIFLRAPAEGTGLPPNKLRILTVPGPGNGSTPMYAKRAIATLPQTFLNYYVIPGNLNSPAYVNALLGILGRRVDIVIGYNRYKDDVTTGNDAMAELCYHELTHAAHYNKVGDVWYGNFVQAEINELTASVGNATFRPYGMGNTSNSPIIALGESWAYHMGHFMTSIKYGVNSDQFNEQGKGYANNNPVTGLSSNLNLLEDFNPISPNDFFRWIPQGLYYDMFDARNETGAPVNDGVSNYTNQQFFNALDFDITTLQNYRQRLLSENGNSQSVQVLNIFTQYGY